jgi:chemotaxis protein CheD
MPEQTIPVGLGELAVSNRPEIVLVAYGLGSCLGVVLFDPQAKVGAMLHAMLPVYRRSDPNKTKYVDSGIPVMLEELEKMGAVRSRLVCRMAGGAQMLVAPGFNNVFNIGAQNVERAREVLRAQGVRVRAEDTGGHFGRTVKLFVADGRVTVRSLGKEEREL